MVNNNEGIVPIIVAHPDRSRVTATVNDRPQRSVAEQIADLTIAAPLPALELSDLVTEPPRWGYELCVVGTFLTKWGMNLQAIRRVLPSVWEPGRGVEVDELEGGLYLFRFEHQLDVRKVMDKGPWHFNGVLLVTHELRQGELPDQVPLTQIPFWVQVHNLHFGYFNESVGTTLGNFVGRFLNYDERNDIEYPDAYMRIHVMLDVRALLQKERLVKLYGCVEVTCTFRYERLWTFYFICGILGHKEHQCELRYRFPKEQLPFLWDDSIKAISRQEARARAANPWLQTRDRTTQGHFMGTGVQGRGRGMYCQPVIQANVRELAVCMGANTWDKDKHIKRPQLPCYTAIPLNLDEKKRRRMEGDEIELMDTEDTTRQPHAKKSPIKKHQSLMLSPPHP
ncbi:hypothetical protein LINGRAHAP2_LOCUS14902 [Linum grandiflorum]